MSQISILFKDRILSVHQLSQDEPLMIGQSDECQLQIDSLAIQSKHAKISYSDRVYSIESMDSDAAIHINSIEVDTLTPLSDGDDISIGKHSLIFNFDERNKNTSTTTPDEAITQHLTGWLQYINGVEMGKTKPIKQKMQNISDEQENNVALISRRADGFYISYLKGEESPRVNDVSIGEKSLKLESNSEISLGAQKILFYMD